MVSLVALGGRKSAGGGALCGTLFARAAAAVFAGVVVWLERSPCACSFRLAVVVSGGSPEAFFV